MQSRVTWKIIAFKELLEKIFTNRILAFDSHPARKAAQIFARLRQKGLKPEYRSIQLVALAATFHATLATCNTEHFVHTGIAIVNPWVAISNAQANGYLRGKSELAMPQSRLAARWEFAESLWSSRRSWTQFQTLYPALTLNLFDNVRVARVRSSQINGFYDADRWYQSECRSLCKGDG